MVLNHPNNERLFGGDPDLQWRSTADRSYYFGDPALLVKYLHSTTERYVTREYLLGTDKDFRDSSFDVHSHLPLAKNLSLQIRQEKGDNFSALRVSSANGQEIEFAPLGLRSFVQAWSRCITTE